MNSTIGVSGLEDLSSPIPYIFGGLALMLGVIAVALLILACSYRRRYSSSNSLGVGDEEKPSKVMMMDSEPKIVVIMAGESNPTFLATPIPSTSHAQQPL
ncbi:hypothetical protein RJT34_18487 [Clitoria ternatea]|uniref:Uncharacterized protein n=1 Tax=Clitoria ternatea TaxID=43366 RepID=A0AAN9PFW0_CLITE